MEEHAEADAGQRVPIHDQRQDRAVREIDGKVAGRFGHRAAKAY
jgi:hypothetical protein